MNNLFQSLLENGMQLAKRVRKDNDNAATASTAITNANVQSIQPQFELFFSLPEEIGLHILSFLNARDLCAVSSSSKDMLRFTRENALWKGLCKSNGWKVSRRTRREAGWFDFKQYYSEKETISRPTAMKYSDLGKTHGTAPTKRFKHTATVVGKNVIFIGGQETDTKRFNEVIYFNSETNTFSRPNIKGTVPNFSRHTSVLIKDRIFIFGGFDGFGTNFDLAVFDPVNYSWTTVDKSQVNGTCPASRTNHAAAAVGSKMFLFGGNNNSESGAYQVLGDFHCLDTETMTWSQPETTGDKPTARSGHCMTAIGSKLYLFGGGVWNETNGWVEKYTDIHVLDTETMQWSKPATTGTIESSTFAISFAVGRFLFVFGGGSKPKHCVTNDLYVLDTTSFNWSTPVVNDAENKPQPRDMGTACIVNNTVYLMGGYAGGPVDYFNKLTLNNCNPVLAYNPASMIHGVAQN